MNDFIILNEAVTNKKIMLRYKFYEFIECENVKMKYTMCVHNKTKHCVKQTIQQIKNLIEKGAKLNGNGN